MRTIVYFNGSTIGRQQVFNVTLPPASVAYCCTTWPHNTLRPFHIKEMKMVHVLFFKGCMNYFNRILAFCLFIYLF